MSERIPCIPTWENDYWESWSEQLGLPSGTVYSAKSYREYQNGVWAKEKLLRRQHNVSIATGRVRGQYLQGGNKR